MPGSDQDHPGAPVAPSSTSHANLVNEAMLDYLRATWCRRLLLALVLSSFLPVSAATLACQIDCAFDHRDVPQGPHAGGHGIQESSSAPQGGSHLMHAGPCHLGALPALPSAATVDTAIGLPLAWGAVQVDAPASCTWPPPEQRPKA